MSPETLWVLEVRKGSVYVRSKLWQAKRKGPGEKNKKKRVVSRFPAFTAGQLNKQESGRVFSSSSSRFPGDASPARSPPFHPGWVQWQSPPRSLVGSRPAPLPPSGSPPPHLLRPAGGGGRGRHVPWQPPSEAAFATR